jgi:hypothetical protein
MKKIKISKWIFFTLTLLLTVFIVVSSCLPGSESTKESGWLVDLFKTIINTFVPNAVNEGNYSLFSSVIRTLVGHFGLFLVNGVFVTLTIYFYQIENNKPNNILMLLTSLSFGLTLAIVTELIQIFVPYRYGDILDTLIDFLGHLVAVLTIYIILVVIKKKNKKTIN